ncbi:MAG: hypothetical protein AUH86_22995 [Acidobacteria bacterium 13_1_40CM_4_58_4]|nr:MAG: hypothetical protein AUH86_22995 [Acidobacteria bacterium 13_1_40CM_4_58_4]
MPGPAGRVGQHQSDRQAGNRFACERNVLDIAEEQRTTAIRQQRRDLVRMERRIQRYGCASGCNDAQVCGHPARMIVSQNGNPRAGLKPVFHQPAADRFRHPPRFSIGVALNPVATLDLEGNVLGPALGTFAETGVESRHGLAGNIPEKPSYRPRSENRLALAGALRVFGGSIATLATYLLGSHLMC